MPGIHIDRFVWIERQTGKPTESKTIAIFFFFFHIDVVFVHSNIIKADVDFTHWKMNMSRTSCLLNEFFDKYNNWQKEKTTKTKTNEIV